MSLIYRGHIAQPSPSAKTIETGMNGTFLGRSFPIRKAKQIAPPRAADHLQYRGVMY
ncbi:MAG: DUF4278 domain-containing protein [Leptolyngbyaceae bacterium]|nr:DUF4278 domain-containing protein [Leptolyngbyaceae bacterium]